MQLETNEEGNGTPGPLLTGGTGGLGLLAARTMPVTEPPAQLTCSTPPQPAPTICSATLTWQLRRHPRTCSATLTCAAALTCSATLTVFATLTRANLRRHPPAPPP